VQAIDTDTRELAHELSLLWAQVNRGAGGAVAALFDELGLTLTQVKALHALHYCGCEISVKDLAERLGLSLPGASRTVDGLLKRGWLERREDTDDRRVRRVGITEEGQDVVRRIEGVRLAGLEAWAQTLTPEQRARLLDVLQDLKPEGTTP
jgi:DNA-binding MarR family transcriptional regulator